jgi:diguanylate cyclase (GGDEF)-like protein/putative nucleotidyltransferase with HDIG domain
MSLFFSDSMPLKARVYIVGAVGLGLPVLAYSLLHSLTQTEYSWLYLAALAAVGSLFPVKIPSAGGDRSQSLTITTTDAFIFTAILLFGPEVAATIAAVEGILSNFRVRVKRIYKRLFNLAELTLVSFVVGKVFYTLQGTPAPLDPTQGGSSILLVNLAFCALLHFTLNSGAVALAIALATTQPFRVLWRENFLWTSLTSVAGASAAALIFLTFDRNYFYAVAVAIPIILVIYYAYKMNLDRINQAQQHVNQLNELYHSTIASLAMAIDAKDQCTHGHVHRVQQLALGLARYCNMENEKEVQGLRAASLLHDIGKLAIPEYILNKPSPLTAAEMNKMKAHPTVGAEILETVPFPYPVVPFVRHHHERWDGTGYPAGLKGTDIPLGARILSIVDCYDALRTDRPYRQKLPRDLSLNYIKSEAGKSYDPDLVAILIDHIDELESNIKDPETQIPASVLNKLGGFHQGAGGDEREIRKTVFHDIASTQREIQAVYEISQSLGKSLNVSETLTLLSTKIKNLVPYTSCAVYLISSQSDKMLPHHTSGAYSEILDSVEIRIGEGVTGWVAANNQTVLNVSAAPDFPSVKLLRTEFTSCLAVPLSIEDNVVGVISLYSKEPSGFQSDHLRLMEMIAHHAAVAINNAIVYEETQEDAYTDLLTGLPNLRYFNVFVEQELKRAGRISYPVTLLMMDLDAFKEVNDQHGHKVGDRMLIEIAHILRNQMRKSDMCIRYAGDEFVAVLPGVNKHQAEQTIVRIQTAVDSHQMPIRNGETAQVGMSIGAACFPDDSTELEALISIADQAMYRNKVSRSRKKRRPADILPFEKR